MPDWKHLLRGDPIPWLLDPANPSVRYRTLVDLLDRPVDDPEVQAARASIRQVGVVSRILDLQGEGGSWGPPARYYDDKYGGTSWQLLVLAEHDVPGDDPRVRAAGELILDLARDRESGGFAIHGTARGGGRHSEVIPCLTGNLTWALLRLGFEDDPRLEAAWSFLARTFRVDDGDTLPPANWPYQRLEICWGRHTCHMGVVKSLKAFAALPEARRSPDVRRAIDDGVAFLLLHRIHRRSHDPTRDSKPGWRRFGFPHGYTTDILEILGVLADLGVRDPRMDEAVDVVLSKQDGAGRWKMEQSFNGKFLVDVEEKGEPSRWLTLHALRVLRFIAEGRGGASAIRPLDGSVAS